MGITAWDFTGNPTSAVLKNGYDPFSVGSLRLLPTCRCVFLVHEQRKCSLVAGREAEGLKKHLSTSCWFDQRRSPTHWRGDKHQARSGLTLIGFDVVSGGKKNLLLAKIEQKALHVLSDKTHVTPPLPCFHGHVVRDFPQAAPRLLGVSAANGERRTRFRRGASWETTVDEETDEETEMNFFFGRRSRFCCLWWQGVK